MLKPAVVRFTLPDGTAGAIATVVNECGERPGYVRKIVEALESGRLPSDRISDIDVRHDAGCPALERGAWCSCSDPEVVVR